MKIPLKNKFLEVKLLVSISTVPNVIKLERELEDFFKKNKVGGHAIEEFSVIQEELGNIHYKIVPLVPCLDESLSDEDDCAKEIGEIGKKYGIKNLGFVYWCYHK